MTLKDDTKYHQWLLSLAPEVNPVGWLTVNLICLGAGLVALVDNLEATEDLSERPTATALYLVFNFGTTIVWLAEVGLSLYLLQSREEARLATSGSKIIELPVATYMTANSLDLLWQWKIQKKHIEEQLFDIIISVLSYIYLSYEVYHRAYGHQPGENGACGVFDDTARPAGESTALIV